MIPDTFLDAKMSDQTYVSYHKQEDFEKMLAVHDSNYKFPILRQIQVPVKIIVGDEDPFFHPANPKNPVEALNALLKNIKKSEGKLIRGSAHVYQDHEKEVSEEV